MRFAPHVFSPLSRVRALLGGVTIAALTASVVVPAVSAHAAEDSATEPGTFVAGGGVTGGIDHQSGEFVASFPVVSLPGLDEAVSLSVSYSQERALSGHDDGFGTGWAWGLPRVAPSDGNGVTVFPASGGRFEADETVPSGLADYPQQDLKFRNDTRGIAERNGDAETGFTARYVLEYRGGKDFFDETGHLRARFNAFGQRTDYVWNETGHLARLVDGVGNTVVIVPTDEGINVVSPVRGDGQQAITSLGVRDERLISVTNPVHETVQFGYEDTSRGAILSSILSSPGVRTDVSYGDLPDGEIAVSRVALSDARSGDTLSVRRWRIVGEHTATGFPDYANKSELWASGDGAYQYETVLDDEKTSVSSRFNSLGLLVAREVSVTIDGGTVPVERHDLAYPGTEAGGVPQTLPANYAKPTETTVTYRNERGEERSVAERTAFDAYGRATEHTVSDGTTTTTRYNEQVPVASNVPGGLTLPLGFVSEQTVTGRDGTIARVLNTPDAQALSVAKTQTSTGSIGTELVAGSQTEIVTDAAGFVTSTTVVAANQPGVEGPSEVTARSTRVVDMDAKTVTVQHVNAADTDAQFVTSETTDLVSGLPISTRDAVGREAVVQYDVTGRPVYSKDAAGRESSFTYDDRVTRVKNDRGIIESDYVDALGRLVAKTDNLVSVDGAAVPRDGAERTIETRRYDKNGAVMAVTDALGRETTSVTDSLGRPTRVTSLGGVTQKIAYDDVRNTVTTSVFADPSAIGDAKTTRVLERDDRGRESGMTGTRSDNVAVPEARTTYDGIGRVTESTASDLRSTITYGADDTPVTTTMAPQNPGVFSGETVSAQRAFDGFGTSTQKTLTSTSGEKRAGVSRVLDAAGRTSSQRDQEGGVVTFHYTPDGLVERAVDQRTGVVTDHTYDPVTRALIETVTADGARETRRAYEYNTYGDLVAICDPRDREGTRVSYHRDARGQVTAVQYPDGKSVARTFDIHGRAESVYDVVGNVTTYRYDDSAFLREATQVDSQGSVIASVRYDYDVYGRVTALTRTNGVVSVYTYTSTDQVRSEKTTDSSGATIFAAEYDYDTHGNVTRATSHQVLPGERSVPVTTTTSYEYNVYDQLTASKEYHGDSTVRNAKKETHYVVGASGNVEKETVTENDTVMTREFTIDGGGRTTTVITNGDVAQQHYDAAGNLVTAADGTTYRYDLDNRVVGETRGDGTVNETTYWANGQRRSRATQDGDRSQVTEFYWDGATLVNEVHGETGVSAGVSSYLLGSTRAARTLSLDTVPGTSEDGARETDYYVADRHGSVRALTDQQGTGATAYAYTDYGRTITYGDDQRMFRNSFRYAGEWTDESDAQKLGDRTFTPATMSFTTKDTADQFNLYSYVDGNPITRVDPTGQTAESDVVQTALTLGTSALSLMLEAAFLAIPTGGASLLAFGVSLAGMAIDGATVAEKAQELSTVSGSSDSTSSESTGGANTAGIVFGVIGAVIVGVAFGAAVAPAARSLDVGRFIRPLDDEARIVAANLAAHQALGRVKRAYLKFNAAEINLGLTGDKLRKFPFDEAKAMMRMAQSDEALEQVRKVSLDYLHEVGKKYLARREVYMSEMSFVSSALNDIRSVRGELKDVITSVRHDVTDRHLMNPRTDLSPRVTELVDDAVTTFQRSRNTLTATVANLRASATRFDAEFVHFDTFLENEATALRNTKRAF